MALARVKTWIPGDILTASDLNAEFNNILNNPVSLISNATSLVAGDLLIASTDATPVLSRLALGSTTQYLGVASSSGQPAWLNAGTGTRVSGLVATISSQLSTCAARQYVFQTTDGARSFLLNSTAGYTINVGTAGPAAGGRDTAGVFSSTFVHLYAISTGANSTSVAGTASTAIPPTGPVMPTGYSAWCYLGGMPYTSASTTMYPGYLAGRKTHFGAIAVTPSRVLSAGVSTAVAQVSISSAVPANAVNFDLFLEAIQSTAAAGVTHNVYLGTTTIDTSTFMRVLDYIAQVVSVSHRMQLTIELPNISQGLYYFVNTTAVSATIDVTGFTNPNGGE